MQVHLRTRRATVALAGALALAGCSAGTPAGTSTGTPPGAAAATPAPTATTATAAPPTASGPRILEDAGLETLMPAGTYTSRLFEPTLTLELDDSWFRRDAGTDRKLNIRRGPDGGQDLTFVSGVDFIQCGAGDVIEEPDAQTVIDSLVDMPKLHAVTQQIQIGDLVGTEIVLPGGGKGSLDDPLEDWLANGCVLSNGDVAFPEESAWMVEFGSTVELLAVVDVDGRAVVIRARPDDTDVDALWDYMREVISTVQLG